MANQLEKILEEAKEKLASADSTAAAEEIRVRLLGKKGRMTELLRSMKDMAPEERKSFGQEANKARAEIEEQVLESLSDGGDDWFAAEKVNECLDIIDKYRTESEG